MQLLADIPEICPGSSRRRGGRAQIARGTWAEGYPRLPGGLQRLTSSVCAYLPKYLFRFFQPLLFRNIVKILSENIYIPFTYTHLFLLSFRSF